MQTASTNICERMGRSQELSEFQRGTVIGCHLCNKSSREISSWVNIPQSAVSGIITKWKRLGTTAAQPRSGRPGKMTERGHRMHSQMRFRKNGQIFTFDLIWPRRDVAYFRANLGFTSAPNLHILYTVGKLRVLRFQWYMAIQDTIWTVDTVNTNVKPVANTKKGQSHL